jgi:hypothetical protein
MKKGEVQRKPGSTRRSRLLNKFARDAGLKGRGF